jgi:nucleoid-associated protein YgaU
MQKLVITAIAVVLASAGVANAQTTSSKMPDSDAKTTPPVAASPAARQGPSTPEPVNKPAAATETARPAAATAKSDTDMAAGAASDEHKQACAARYKTYDPATDMFFARPGVKQRCRLKGEVVPPT